MEPLPVPAGLEGRVRELWERARKRWLINMAIALVVGPVVGVLIARLISPDHPRHSTHGHRHVVLGVVLLILFIAIYALVITILIRRLRRRYKGQWIPLAAGLSRRDRQHVRRAVRRGEPSADQFLRYVETTTARKVALQRRQLRWSLPLSTVVWVFLIAANWTHNRAAVWFGVIMLLAVLLTLPRTIHLIRGADRYLRTVNLDPDALRKTG